MDKGSISHYLLPKNRSIILMMSSDGVIQIDIRSAYLNQTCASCPFFLWVFLKEEGKNTTKSLTDNPEEIFFYLLVILPTDFWRK